MTPVPLDLPIRPSEAAVLGNLIFDHAERKPLTDEVRNRLAARAAVAGLESIAPRFGSLDRDPVHPSSYYLAVDGAGGEPLLLHLALASAPTSSIFHKPLLIGRMRRPNGTEMVINAISFGAADHGMVELFAARVDHAFLPRPQGSRTAIVAAPCHPEETLPAAFDAFRAIWKRTGKNVAAIGAAPGAPVREAYSAGLWSAIRAGWREGYSAGVEIAAGGAIEDAKEAIRQRAAFTSFAIDAVPLLCEEAVSWSNAEVEEAFERDFTTAERGWIFDEFVRRFDLGEMACEFAPIELPRLAVMFGRSLDAAERLHEAARQARSALKTGRSFDFELSVEAASRPATAKDLAFCLHWLKARGRPAQLVAPNVGAADGLPARLAELAAVARHFQCTLSLSARAEYGPEELDIIARATGGRVNYRLCGALAALPGSIALAAEHLVG